MILEGIVTTLSPSGELNVAPMGPEVAGPDFDRFVLKPFQTSTTFANLTAHGEGVLHVVDDVRLIARGALGAWDRPPATRSAEKVNGLVLADCTHYYEFRVRSIDASNERTRIEAEVVASGFVRKFFGFNRAMFAVVEAAILATRLHLLPRDQVLAEFARLRVLVEKTAGEREREAFALLETSVNGGPPPCPRS